MLSRPLSCEWKLDVAACYRSRPDRKEALGVGHEGQLLRRLRRSHALDSIGDFRHGPGACCMLQRSIHHACALPCRWHMWLGIWEHVQQDTSSVSGALPATAQLLNTYPLPDMGVPASGRRGGPPMLARGGGTNPSLPWETPDAVFSVMGNMAEPCVQRWGQCRDTLRHPLRRWRSYRHHRFRRPVTSCVSKLFQTLLIPVPSIIFWTRHAGQGGPTESAGLMNHLRTRDSGQR